MISILSGLLSTILILFIIKWIYLLLHPRIFLSWLHKSGRLKIMVFLRRTIYRRVKGIDIATTYPVKHVNQLSRNDFFLPSHLFSHGNMPRDVDLLNILEKFIKTALGDEDTFLLLNLRGSLIYARHQREILWPIIHDLDFIFYVRPEALTKCNRLYEPANLYVLSTLLKESGLQSIIKDRKLSLIANTGQKYPISFEFYDREALWGLCDRRKVDLHIYRFYWNYFGNSHSLEYLNQGQCRHPEDNFFHSDFFLVQALVPNLLKPVFWLRSKKYFKQRSIRRLKRLAMMAYVRKNEALLEELLQAISELNRVSDRVFYGKLIFAAMRRIYTFLFRMMKLA